ncbi:unnamed protein product [Adineta steineri]|uniref:RING-type domain-containing protein n=3 Tax=Adineta steineri TaxID=433720 RepID=A0A819JBH7_9BILA|nr:unnamed protein product [Adineta steineri]CAF3928010.1 unnamed protein product [Adineta steineri]
MARSVLTMNNNIIMPSISFHQRTFGQNIRLDDNGVRATRHTSFDNGVTFTNKQIKMNERIHMKIIDVDETGQWLGSLAIGFTQIDPDSIQRKDLCKSSLPNLCFKDGISYIKRISDKLTRQIIITFYYNQDGAFYILDGKEQELSKNIDLKRPLWGIIDIYGNVKGVVFTTPMKAPDNSKSFFIKYDQKPDLLPICHYKHLKFGDLQSITFHHIHGLELELFCQNKVAFRKNVPELARPYVFIDLPMAIDDEYYLRILSIDPNYRTPGVIGFTNVNPSIFNEKFESLPSVDPMGLYDRKEYWIIVEDAFDEKLSELDEYRFIRQKDGDIQICRNNDSNTIKTIACTDPQQTFYPFFFLNGRIAAFSLIGLISSTNNAINNNKKTKEKDENAGLCQICLDTPASCVLIPCGHIVFCSDCKDSFEKKFSEKRCPICRDNYNNVFQIEDD